MNNKLKKLIVAAMFMALICVATMLSIPSPATNGYLNLGDCIVLLSAYMLGPVYGAAAAGVGSALADWVLGYSHYIPGTIVIKTVVALVSCLMYNILKKTKLSMTVSLIFSGVIGEQFMVAGYFGYAALILGKGIVAATSIPGNIVQAVVGIAVSSILFKVLSNNKYIKSKLYL